MQVEDRRSRDRRVNQVAADREAEAVGHDRGDQQRHEQVEVPVERTSAPDAQSRPPLSGWC